MKCCYCDHDIIMEGLDWGMSEVDYAVRWWHAECFEIFEMDKEVYR